MGRRQFSGFRDRTVSVNFFRHFIRPSQREMDLNGFDARARRVPIVQLYDVNDIPIIGQLGIIATGNLRPFDNESTERLPANIDVVILPADNYAPNLQDLGFNTYYEYVVYPRMTITGITDTDVMRYQNPQETLADYTELSVDRIVNDPGGYQAFFVNTLSKPQ